MGLIGFIGLIECIGFRLPPTGLVTIDSRSSPASAACTSRVPGDSPGVAAVGSAQLQPNR